MIAIGDSCHLKFQINNARCKSGYLYQAGPEHSPDANLVRVNELSFSPCLPKLVILAEKRPPSEFGSGHLNSGFEIWRAGKRVVQVNILQKGHDPETVRLEKWMSGYYRVNTKELSGNGLRIEISQL
ncbi:MAG: hypothetical protein QOC81_4686 [Thermoanaerobaculia bacterium]|jgi:hypothetical protein|nr:hypothetical protein [Thermoanaerobaculia bacterium]